MPLIRSAAELPNTGYFRAYPLVTPRAARERHDWIYGGSAAESYYWLEMQVVYIPFDPQPGDLRGAEPARGPLCPWAESFVVGTMQ